uniref:Fibronectin type-III domain-containing protein n=1 Tax=Pelusios castaneus TaxID=367368 RepID=A0A8C8RRR7_9SAUR
MGKDIWRVCLQVCSIAIGFSGRGEGIDFPGNLSCLNNYVYRMDCTWETNERVGDGPFHLHFTDLLLDKEEENKDASCALSTRDGLRTRHHCTVNMTEMFTELDSYRISLQGVFFGRHQTYIAFPDYEPRLNIKCDPPFDLKSNINASKCQLRWHVPWPLESILQYELEYKEHNASWQQAQRKRLFNSAREVEIEATEFKAAVTYTARVRGKTSQAEESYKSQWSEWSQTTEFQRETSTDFLQESEKSFDTSVIRILFIPVCLGIVLYVILNFRLSSRAKNIFSLDVPTPAAFFQPLYTLHNGNFKDWVGPNETCGRLSREEANHPSKVTVDGALGLSAHEAISQLSCKSLTKTKMILPGEICSSASGPSQQQLWSSGGTEARPPSLFLHPADEAGALDFSEASETSLVRSDMSRNHPPYVRCHGAGDFFMPQESLELESLSFCSNDYCTLCGSDSVGGPIPVHLLQLTKEDRLAKH